MREVLNTPEVFFLSFLSFSIPPFFPSLLLFSSSFSFRISFLPSCVRLFFCLSTIFLKRYYDHFMG